MKKFINFLFAVFFISNIFAAEYGGVTASPYLNLGVGARPSGMGEAYTAVVDNVDAAWWNPGNLVKVENPQFAFMHNQNFGDTSYEYLAVAFPATQLGLDIWGTIGITAVLVRVSDIEITKEDEFGQYSEAYEAYKKVSGIKLQSAGGAVIGLSYSWQAAKMFSVGATVKVINQKIASEQGWIPAMDIGILSNTNVSGFDVGIVFQNVTFLQMNQIEGAPDAPLPLNLKFGICYKLPRLFTSEQDPRDKFVFGLDGIYSIQPANMPFKLHTGIEYLFNVSEINFTPRIGYRFNGQNFISDLGALAGLTVGFGVSKNFDGVDVSLDYAFIPYGILGQSHRIGLNINVGQPKPKPKPKPVVNQPPKVVKLKPGKKEILVTWSPPEKVDKDKIKGYNVYMSYKPGGKYYKLTKTPIPPTKYYLKVAPLKSGLRCYFVVTTVGMDDKESPYSKEISAVPR
ncbi:MAG: PorV/PorQ family protein [Candidatus Goldbacteria bacterium]|nr:PorV/PorQ family protein [Candidatus Goldiibacteriota bacterium]